MPLLNGPSNCSIRPMTPKQAAMLAELIWQQQNGRSDAFCDAVRVLQEWDLFPWLLVNGSEQIKNLEQWTGFLEEWLEKLKEYSENCPKEIQKQRKCKGAEMPGVETGCTTHHYACECREAAIKELDKLYQRIIAMHAKPVDELTDNLIPRLQKIRQQLWSSQNK